MGKIKRIVEQIRDLLDEDVGTRCPPGEHFNDIKNKCMPIPASLSDRSAAAHAKSASAKTKEGHAEAEKHHADAAHHAMQAGFHRLAKDHSNKSQDHGMLKRSRM